MSWADLRDSPIASRQATEVNLLTVHGDAQRVGRIGGRRRSSRASRGRGSLEDGLFGQFHFDGLDRRLADGDELQLITGLTHTDEGAELIRRHQHLVVEARQNITDLNLPRRRPLGVDDDDINADPVGHGHPRFPPEFFGQRIHV